MLMTPSSSSCWIRNPKWLPLLWPSAWTLVWWLKQKYNPPKTEVMWLGKTGLVGIAASSSECGPDLISGLCEESGGVAGCPFLFCTSTCPQLQGRLFLIYSRPISCPPSVSVKPDYSDHFQNRLLHFALYRAALEGTLETLAYPKCSCQISG